MVRTKGGLERNAPEVIKAILLGEPGREIARRHKVTESAVRHFRERHASEIQPALEELVKQASDYAIASVVNRVADLQLVRDLAVAQIQKDGLKATDIKMAANGDTVEVTYTDKAIADILLKALDDAAAETGGRLKPTGPTVFNDNRTQVLIREVRGVEVPLG